MATKAAGDAPPKKEVAFNKAAIDKDQEKKDGHEETNRPSLVRQASKEAIKALSGGIGDAIVDMRLSATEKEESDLSRNGYVQLFQDKAAGQTTRRTGNQVATSTFGNHASLWTWSRSQGTCSGRLKPIIDVQLHSAPTSSDFVLAGYTCDTTPISGQWLWIKRATTEEEEKDAIVDLYISTGKMKDTSDPIWTSPGVGWVRVEGNFTKSFFGGVDTILWLRPARTRSMEVHMASPIRGAVALTEEVRYAKLMSACRLALRHYVSVENVKRLATIVMETAAVSISAGINSNVIRSERMVDYTALYHQTVKKGQMHPAQLNKLLFKVGLRFDAKDLVTAFSLFDRRQNGVVSLEEFCEVLNLTDYEIDLAIEKIRVHLLKGCSSPNDASASGAGKPPSRQGAVVPPAGRPNAGVLGSSIITSKSQIGKNIIRENFTLVQVFNMVNTKDDGIFSLDEMMDLSTKVEVFLTEEEARKCLSKMDLDGDDRVEEADFITFMRNDSNATVNKAFRVRECASTLRRWLVRGTTENASANSTASASAQQWKAFKKQYEKHTKRAFPNYLDAQIMLITMSNQGTRLSALEARELTLLVAPEKNGRIHQADLHSFMGREHRSYGELIALMERELMKDIIDAYRAHDAANTAHGAEDADLAEMFRRKIGEVKKAVEKVYLQPPPGAETDPTRAPREGEGEGEEEVYTSTNNVAAQEYGHRLKRTNMEVISIVQLKDGLEFFFKEKATNSSVADPQLPNLEEWASLAVLVNADVCEGDIYGVRLKDFLEGICAYAVNAAMQTRLRQGERLSVEQVSRELQRQIYVEALNCGKGKKPDFKAVFDIFDENKSGDISLAEFKIQLKRLQLVSKLAEHQLPTLLAMFTKSKHQVKLEDFIAFAQKGGKGGALDESDEEKEADKDDDADEDDIEDMTSNVPPVTITRNSDCDWLLWFLYREARKVDPLDPESVITELQIRCNETELTQKDPAISVKEMWNHLFELSLQGGMSHAQFIKGVQLVCQHGNGKDDDRVDYEALCRYVIRMGRAFNALIQQRAAEDEGKFAPLLVELKKYFKDLSQEKVDGSDEKAGVARYEKIFRRIDTDGDGMLTIKEFRTGLRRLQYKNFKAWNLRMVRRLFDECDKNRDGLLSIKEFSNYVLDMDTPARLALADKAKAQKQGSASEVKGGKGGKGSSEDRLNLSDDEEDEVFRKNKVLTDHQLLRKVNDTLMDVVPVDPHGPGRHADVVRGSVRRFFQRADPEHRGTVSEERFRAFLRRSGLQDNLTTSELRRLTDKLKKRGTGKGEMGEMVIDYEKLCQQMNVATETIPKSKAEVVLSRFQDAANASAAAGRSFLSLCSLVDLHLTGKMTRDELIHTAKMMDYPMTPYDLEAMIELLPSHAVGSDEKIDYRVVQNVLSTFTPRQTRAYDIEPHLSAAGLYSGALPAYASPGRMGATTHMSYNFPGGMHASYNEVSTPLGGKVQTPYSLFDDPLSATLRPGMGALDLNGTVRGQAPASSGAYERILRLIVERVKNAVEERTRTWGPTYNLRGHLEYFDNDRGGTVPTRSFQQVMQEIGVLLSPSDLQTLYGLYGRPEDNHIFYDAFLRAVDGNTSTSYPPGLPAHMQNAGVRRSVAPPAPPTLGNNNRSTTGAAYLHPRVLQRLRELKQEGNEPRDFFMAQDVDRCGMVPQGKFAAVISKLQLLQTDHQLTRAIDDFSSMSNRAMVLYDDFLDSLETAANAEGRVSLTASMRRSSSGGFVNGSGYDGLRGSQGSNDPWADDLRRFRQSNTPRGGYGDYPIELEDGSDSAYGAPSSLLALSPPKVSDSLTFSRVGSLGGRGSPSRYHRSSEDISPRSSYQRTLPIPKSSPSKVGSKMWGSDTPLAKKGKVLNVGDGHWCCAVCLYTENALNAQTCAVCDSPNYTIRKDYQVKEQCRNCTFLNGQFADECEMCGEPLSNSTHQSSRSFNKAGGGGKYL